MGYRFSGMQILRNSRFQSMMRVLFWLALIFAVAMAVMPTPPAMPLERMGDKFAHMTAFAALAGLAALGFPAANRWLVAERLSFLGALIEVTQSIPQLQRDCDIADWGADTLAIVVVTVIVGLILGPAREQVREEA